MYFLEQDYFRELIYQRNTHKNLIIDTLLGTSITPEMPILKMMFQRWHILVSLDGSHFAEPFRLTKDLHPNGQNGLPTFKIPAIPRKTVA